MSPVSKRQSAPRRQEREGKPGRLRTLSSRLLLLIATVLVTALLLEPLVILVCGEQPKFPRRVVGAPWGLRYNEPRASYRHKSADVSVRFAINAQGMRANEDYAYEKPPGVKRVLVLGDSFTIGYEVALEETFSHVIQEGLARAGLRVQVLNTGVSGFSNAEECLYLERELSKYDPDLVLVAFYVNDLTDNVRTGLFSLDEKGALVQEKERYVPAGSMGDFLNTNSFFNFFSERSNAFVLFKERLNRALKRRMVEEEEQIVGLAPAEGGSLPPPDSDHMRYQKRLAAAIFDRMYRFLSDRGIPLVVLSIPAQPGGPGGEFVDVFPTADFDVTRPGLRFLAGKDLLEPHRKTEVLYWQRSHFHWTPFSHAVAGDALTAVILAQGLVRE